MLGRRYPDQAATVEQTEAKFVEAEIQVEERKHALYSLKAVEPSQGEATGPSSAKIDRASAAARPAPSTSAKSATATAQQPPATALGSFVAARETAAVDAFFVSTKPDHPCNDCIKCRQCRSTASRPWLPSSGNGRRMAKILMRMDARLTEEEQLEFGRMYNLVRINVAKKTKATKDAFHAQLQAFVVRHGILSEYNEFATLQRPEAKTRDSRLPLFDDE